ncbi:MAG: AmmeMemoRadiSam system protein B [Nitrospira sp.]|nr:AmmeMemoRadiSam system protein B [Nitrospira sp.]
MSLRKIFLTAVCLLLTSFLIECSGEIKEPSVAGTFYPAQKDTLKKMVDDFLSKASRSSYSGKLIALVSPHAGYKFSGQVAAYSYKQFEGRDIKTVILIGSSHYKNFSGISVYAKGSMRTPLGDVKVNEKIARALLNENADIRFYRDAFEREHSLEVQLPFLQKVVKDFTIVPILTGTLTKKSFEYLTERLIEILREDEKTIIVASTDLSHFHDYNTAMTMDRKMIDAIERMSIGDIEGYLMSRDAEMCGGYAVIITMAVARGLGANNGLLYKYANSGDITNDRDRVVGYAAMGLYKTALTKEDKNELLSLARRAIVDYVMNKKILEIEMKNPRLKANGAVFVTIKKNGNLRGCIGNIHPVKPLYQAVISNAISASSRDPRFLPMNKEELKDMDIEISILSAIEPLKDTRRIEIGTHGLYIVKEQRSGLLLPQVAKEHGWDRDMFLEQLCMKAGLPKDAWRNAKLYRFSAEIIP